MSVLFPCDVDTWPEVARRLQVLQHTSSPGIFPGGSNFQVAITIDLSMENEIHAKLKLLRPASVWCLHEIFNLIHGTSPEQEQAAAPDKPQERKRNNKPFQGLELFFKKEATDKERVTFFQHTFPVIVNHILQIEARKPDGGIGFLHQQNSGRVSLPRPLAASIVAASFLCLWPGRAYNKHSVLCSINFDNFFCHLGNKGQCGKLRLILHYFERTAQEYLTGNVVFERKVVPQENLPTIEEWLHCETKLCDILVHNTGRIEDAGPTTLQVDFANRKLGGAVLSTGRVQEEIRFACCPELIAGMLFMEEMQDNEAFVIHGFLNYAQYSGYARDLAFVGPFNDRAQRDCTGNLDNHLVAIDASPARRIGGAEKQYLRENMLRELNKAMVGFQQSRPSHRTGSLGEIYKQYFSTLSEDIFTKALGQVLTTSEPTLSDQNITRPRRRSADMATATLPGSSRRNSGQESATPGSRHGSDASTGSRHGGSENSIGSRHSSETPAISRQNSVDLVGVGAASRRNSSDIAAVASSRRNSSEVSVGSRRNSSEAGSGAVGSRRNSGGSDAASRRGSSFSSSSGSRRSSSRKSSSECSFDMEEYLQHLVSRSSKPSVIEEEDDNPIQDFATELITSVFQQGLPLVQESLATQQQGPSKLPSFSAECPKDLAKPTPVSPPTYTQSLECSVPIKNHVDSLVIDAFKEAMDEVAIKLKEKEKLDQERKIIEPFVSNLLDEIWTEVLCGIKEGRVRVVQVEDDESDVEDIDLDLFMYVDDFVHGVMDEALVAYQAEVREEQRQLEAMWQRTRQKMEMENKYFQAEFSRNGANNSLQPQQPKIDRRKGSLNYVKGSLAREMMRRRSLDETGRRRNSGFKDETLSSFENELITSQPNIPSLVLCAAAGRRASEPMTRDDSIDTDFLSVASGKTRASSIDSMSSSREMLLEWLSHSHHSTTTTSGSSSSGRKRTSSSHMDWYAQDMVLDAFNDAFVDMFGADYTCHSKADLASTSSSCKDDHKDLDQDVKTRHLQQQQLTQQQEIMPVVTGNWGCGAYRGDPQLKSLLQWMVASRTNTPLLIYYTFSDQNLINMEQICHLISSKSATVGQLLTGVLYYCDRRQHYRTNGCSLFDILKSIL